MLAIPGKQGSSQQTKCSCFPELTTSCELQPQNPSFSSNLAMIPSEQEDCTSKCSHFSALIYFSSSKNQILGQTPWSMVPETAVDDKKYQANVENNLQDQSIKSEVTVVSGTTFALSRWKHIPVQQDVGANKGIGSCSWLLTSTWSLKRVAMSNV